MLLSLLVACAPPQVDATPGSTENVIVVLADTLRARNMTLYGYDRDTAPHTTAFFQDAAIFEDLTSQGGHTVPAISSLFTGLVPSAHGCCQLYETTLHPDVPTLAQALQGAGYQTAGLHKSYVLTAIDADAGFETFEEVPGALAQGKSAQELTNRTIEWLDERDDRPFFLYVHYTDPHAPYQAPSSWEEQFTAGYDSEQSGSINSLDTSALTDDDLQRLVALYDGEIAYMDHQLQSLWRRLEDGGELDNTAVIFLADHGEEFMEHGALQHHEIWQEQIHVPLMIRAPGATGRRLGERVQTLDLTPTVAGLLGVAPGPEWQGADLSGAVLAGEPIPARDVLVEYGRSLKGLLSPDGLKYIQDGRIEMLFDLNADPDELVDLAASRPEDLAALRDRFEAMQAEASAINALYP